MKLKLCGIAAAVALVFAAAVQAQGTSSTAPAARDQSTMTGKVGGKVGDMKAKHADEEKIEADYKAEKAKCAQMKGNDKEVCETEAKGKEQIAKAELDAKYDPSPRAQEKVAKTKADAEYKVAKEKCDAL